MLRLYFSVHPSSRHNTDIIQSHWSIDHVKWCNPTGIFVQPAVNWPYRVIQQPGLPFWRLEAGYIAENGVSKKKHKKTAHSRHIISGRFRIVAPILRKPKKNIWELI